MSPFSASSIRAFLAKDPRTLNDIVYKYKSNNQCFGSGSVSGSVDMDPGSAKGLLRQKVYFLKFLFFVKFRPVSEYIINIVYKL